MNKDNEQNGEFQNDEIQDKELQDEKLQNKVPDDENTDFSERTELTPLEDLDVTEFSSQIQEPEYIENFKDYDIFEGLDEKEKRRPKGIGFLIAVIVIALVVLGALEYTNIGVIGTAKKYLSGVFEGTTDFFVKNDPQNKIDAALGAQGVEKETNVIPFENAANAQYALSDGDIIIAGANYMAKYNASGKLKWQKATSIAQPIMDVTGDYIVLAEDEGRGICLYYKDKLLYSIQTQSPIFKVDVSSAGDVAATVDKEFFKGGVEVYNKSGRQIFSWNSGSDYVIDAAISGTSRRLAVVLMNTDSSVVSNVQFFNINKTAGYYKAAFTKSAVFNVDFVGNVLDVTADNCIAGLSESGKTKWYNEFGEKQMRMYATDKRGNKIISTENNAIPSVYVYAEGGKLLTSFELDVSPDYVDIYGRTVLYNANRNVFFGTPGSEKTFIASMDIKQLKIINSSTCLIVYNNSIEFIKQ